MRSGSLGKVWLLFSLRAASQNEAGSARSCSSGCSSEYWRSSNDNRNTQPPRPGNPRRGHSLTKIARSSQSDSMGCHLHNIVIPSIDAALTSSTTPLCKPGERSAAFVLFQGHKVAGAQ